MKIYVECALEQFQFKIPHHYSPTEYIPPEYGKKVQHTTADTSLELTLQQKNHIQQVCGKFFTMED